MASSKGLVIAGYYLANENFKDVSSETGHKVADKIAENFPSACLVVVSWLTFKFIFYSKTWEWLTVKR